MGIFSRLSDIINANLNSMLDKAEDPKKLIRLLIQEMEETLVELRSGAARHIAERKEIERQLAAAKRQASEWEGKAELAMSRGREDLARSALQQKHQAQERQSLLEEELSRYQQVLDGVNEDAARLEQKMAEARGRQKSLMARNQQASVRLKARKQLDSHNIDEAISRFDNFEKKVNDLEAELESYDLGEGQSLDAQFREMESSAAVEEELAQLKRKVAG